MTRPYKTQQWYGGKPGRPVVAPLWRMYSCSISLSKAQMDWLDVRGEGNRSVALRALIEAAGGPKTPIPLTKREMASRITDLEQKVSAYAATYAANPTDPPADEPEKIIPVTTEGKTTHGLK